MNLNTNEHIDLLISRHLSGEASADEIRELWAWMNESDENRKYFDGIRFVANKAEASRPYIKVDTDKAWNTVRAMIDASKASPTLLPAEAETEHPAKELRFEKNAKINIQTYTLLKIAAAILLILAIPFSIWKFSGKAPATEAMLTATASVDSVKICQLTDSSSIALNKGSRISYSKDFGRNNRELTLSGEAFFEVKHSADKPFVVKAEETLIKDVGTAFNVKAYPNNQMVEVYVETGEVVFYTLNNPGVSLKKGETGTYYKVTKTFVKKETIDRNLLSYKTRSFVFQNTPLAEAIDMLNRVYTTKFSLANKALTQCRITVSFQNEEPEIVASVIAETLGLQFKQTPDGFVIEGKKCEQDTPTP